MKYLWPKTLPLVVVKIAAYKPALSWIWRVVNEPSTEHNFLRMRITLRWSWLDSFLGLPLFNLFYQESTISQWFLCMDIYLCATVLRKHPVNICLLRCTNGTLVWSDRNVSKWCTLSYVVLFAFVYYSIYQRYKSMKCTFIIVYICSRQASIFDLLLNWYYICHALFLFYWRRRVYSFTCD